MSKLDDKIINNIKLNALEMIEGCGSGNANYAYNLAGLFYSLYRNHLNYDMDNNKWINKDRILINNMMLPIFYSTISAFNKNFKIDNLKDYKMFGSNMPGFAYKNDYTIGRPVFAGDVITQAVGVTLGESYLNNLIKSENPKCVFVDFHTYAICNIEDLINGNSLEALNFANVQKLNKLTIICYVENRLKDTITSKVFTKKLDLLLEGFDYDVIKVKDATHYDEVDAVIDEVKNSKKISIVLLYENIKSSINTEYNKPIGSKKLNELKKLYKVNNEFWLDENIQKEVINKTKKRLDKVVNKWKSNIKDCGNSEIVKNIYSLLNYENINIAYNVDNIKLNDNYNEELDIGNKKIFNLFAMKSPFIVSISDDNFNNTNMSISNNKVLSYDKKSEKNICVTSNLMGGISIGLALLNFKVFVSTNLLNSSILMPSIKVSTLYDLDIHFTFSNDTFLNMYNDVGITVIDELNSLRVKNNLITFRPCDINEIIGIYDLIKDYRKPTVLVIGNEKTGMINGTNPKYVMAGAYRIKREEGECNGVLIASGNEVNTALLIAKDLLNHGIDLRVVSMVSTNLFDRQNNRYKYSLLPRDLKVFTLEYSNSSYLEKYSSYNFCINNYSGNGTKGELLKYYSLDNDSIKAKIIEIMKEEQL